MFDSIYMEIAWAASIACFTYVVTASYYEEKMGRVFAVVNRVFHQLNSDDLMVIATDATGVAYTEFDFALNDLEIVLNGGKVQRISADKRCSFIHHGTDKFCVTHRCEAPAGAPACRVAKP